MALLSLFCGVPYSWARIQLSLQPEAKSCPEPVESLAVPWRHLAAPPISQSSWRLPAAGRCRRLGSARRRPPLWRRTSKTPWSPRWSLDIATSSPRWSLDIASVYGSEQVVGEAVAEVARRGVIASRGEVFVTTKVWCTQCHPDLVLPSLKESLQKLQMEYVDLYLVHWPMSIKPSKPHLSMKREDMVPMDLRGVWEAMEECHRLGLAKMIGVSNFTTKKLQELLAIAKIPPAVNQVELSPVWQQKKLMEFCKEKDIHVTAYSPLGGQTRASKTNAVLQSEVLKEIAEARGKSVAQISLRWIYEQGASMVAKSMKKERLKENIEIFDWELTDEERFKITQIPQQKVVTVLGILSPEGIPGVDFSEVDVVEV